MAALSNRELELMLVNVAAKQRRAPSTPVLAGHAVVADKTKAAIHWFLAEFSPVRLAQAMHERGVTVEWMVGVLADLANNPARRPAAAWKPSASSGR